MQTTIFRNPENLEIPKVIELFRQTLEDTTEFTVSEIEELVEDYAKNPVDKFIVTDGVAETFERQGDILIWAKGSEMYNLEYPRVTRKKKTDRYVLQKDDSMTGDHRLVPLDGATVKIQEGSYIPTFLEGKNIWGDRSYDCILLEIDKPFLIVHREHGNMALPEGEYMVCSQMDSKTLSRMLD